VASVWEVAIKVNIGKLILSTPYPRYVADAVRGYGLTLLPVTTDDCDLYSTLTFPLVNHRDPFDRMLITQARRLGLSVVGADVNFDPYGVPRLW
jgi:PIN domain nuclease of toxin-antitoxin system